MPTLTKREKRKQAFGEFIGYSIVAFIFITLATLSVATCYGLLRLVGLI